MKSTKPPSLDDARLHYREGAAEKYDQRRSLKPKWIVEHQHLDALLRRRVQGTVLDVPVGTGRFLQLYEDLGLKAVGVDYNESMLELARAKHPNVKLEQGDITKLKYPDASFDVVVCVRMLHLVAPSEVPIIMAELLRVARQHVIVTIHLHTKAYVQGRSQVHTHDTLTSCIPRPACGFSSALLLIEKGMPYYMVHVRK